MITSLEELLGTEEAKGGLRRQKGVRRKIGRGNIEVLSSKKLQNLLPISGNEKENCTTKSTPQKKLKGMRKNNDEEKIRTTIRL